MKPYPVYLDNGCWMERKAVDMPWDGFYSMQFAISTAFVPTHEPTRTLAELAIEENR